MDGFIVYRGDELYHHGIKGQKWGIRRYQNEDGTLTPEGEERYLKQLQREERKTIRKEGREHTRQLRENVKKSYAMSDEELRQKINRLQMEKQLKDLTNQQVNKGRLYVSAATANFGKQLLTGMATGAVLYLGKAAVTGKISGNPDFKREIADAIFKRS